MPRFEIKLGETFARIPETFRRIFLHQTGRERHAFMADSRSALNCRNAIARCSPARDRANGFREHWCGPHPGFPGERRAY